MEEKTIINNFAKKIIHLISQYLGAIIILIMLGIFIGISVANSFFTWRVNEAVQVGGFVHNNKVYEVRERVTR